MGLFVVHTSMMNALRYLFGTDGTLKFRLLTSSEKSVSSFITRRRIWHHSRLVTTRDRIPMKTNTIVVIYKWIRWSLRSNTSKRICADHLDAPNMNPKHTNYMYEAYTRTNLTGDKYNVLVANPNPGKISYQSLHLCQQFHQHVLQIVFHCRTWLKINTQHFFFDFLIC